MRRVCGWWALIIFYKVGRKALWRDQAVLLFHVTIRMPLDHLPTYYTAVEDTFLLLGSAAELLFKSKFCWLGSESPKIKDLSKIRYTQNYMDFYVNLIWYSLTSLTLWNQLRDTCQILMNNREKKKVYLAWISPALNIAQKVYFLVSNYRWFV